MEIIHRVLFVGAFTFLISLGASQFSNGKPWPAYSLENMPRTSFTCRDKILGGYYADAETQCQMFHVCVKVAGVGVQDFRFLCPNGTAFDQEAQICADWGDVDCEAATLYYGSDNFDLYRIGSGFESKRAPFAEEEEEATFHLQRAETGDARRGKHVVVNQNTKPEQPSSFGPNIFARTQQKTTKYQQPSSTLAPTTAAKQQTSVSNDYKNNNYYNKYRSSPEARSSSTQASTAKATASNSAFYDNQQKQQNNHYNNDEIFRGSHSSHFFNNRNNGKEDYHNDYNHETTTTVKPRGQVRVRQRVRVNSRPNNVNNITPAHEKSVANITPTKPAQQIPSSTASPSTQQPTYSQQQNYNSYSTNNNYRSQSTAQPQVNRGTSLAQTHSQNQPSTATYRPQTQQQNYYTPSSTPQSPFLATESSTVAGEVFKIPSTTSAYNNNVKQTVQQQQNYYKTSVAPFSTQSENFNTQYQTTGNANKQQPTNDFYTGKVQPTTNYQASSTQKAFDNYQSYSTQTQRPLNNYQETPQRSTAQPVQNTRPSVDNQRSSTQQQTYNQKSNYDLTAVQQSQYNPSQFQANKASSTPSSNYQNIPQSSTFSSTQVNNYYSTQAPILNSSPRGFSVAETTPKPTNINYDKYQTVSRTSENYTPSTVKKFSTLVPRELYDPTTFKPSVYKKPTDAFASLKALQDSTKSLNGVNQYSAASYLPSTTTTHAPQPFQQSQLNDDEDDGQYHPELYERDFARNKFNKQRKPVKASSTVYQSSISSGSGSSSTTYQTTPTTLHQHQTHHSDEEEFLKTAHSQNIAASGNELRAEKAKAAAKAIPQPFSKAPTIPPNATSTKKTPKVTNSKNDKDASYDYAYYDTYSGNPRDYTEYEIIEEFGKTKSKKH